MKRKQFRKLLLIWVLCHLDLSGARREICEYYADLRTTGAIKKLRKDEITIAMLEILDRHELPYSVHSNKYPF